MIRPAVRLALEATVTVTPRMVSSSDGDWYRVVDDTLYAHPPVHGQRPPADSPAWEPCHLIPVVDIGTVTLLFEHPVEVR